MLRRYLKRDPTSANAYQALGLALERQRRSGEAVEVFGQAVQLEPQNPMHLLCLGRALETAFGDIRDEAPNAINLDRDGWAEVSAHAPLRPAGQQPEGSHDWSAVPLFTTGRRQTDIAARLPRTLAAVYLSALKPNARIPPHAGRTNAALTLHLPIVALDGCGLRVGGQDHRWRDGETLVFDDSFQHQAWNDSDTVRLLLVFQVWHPELTAMERRALAASFSALDDWTDSLYGALTIDL